MAHTKGKWQNTLTGIKNDKGFLIAQCWYGIQNNSYGNIPAVPSFDEHCSNSKLIAAAPELLRYSINNYLMLLISMSLAFRCTGEAQIILSNLLTSIEVATGKDRQQLQDFFSSLAYKVTNKETTVELAIDIANKLQF